ncbi:cytochrome P450 [Aspergillus alliaceus]|uniref:cytochrome P450 n=1 Tax=Petromyces alliaceus TaxID=209559 RepID=UPI0012A3C613|nr:cytochrome P450 [Aspergillus alliaceus]KAB8238723.1 cytochrome P450 [Aspergillus alliaceus]
MLGLILDSIHGIPVETVIGLLLGMFAILWTVPFFYNLFFSPLKNVPGPLLARFSILWEFRELWKGHSNEEYIRLHKKYGPVVRVSPKRYSVIDPLDVKQIYEFGGSFQKTNYYDALGEPTNIFTVRNIEEHKDRRRKVASLYTMSSMVAYEGAVDRMTTLCIKKMAQFTTEKKLISMPQFMQFYAFDVIGEITFDQNFGMMENMGDTQGIIQDLHRLNNTTGHMGLLPALQPAFRAAQRVLLSGTPAGKITEYTWSQYWKHKNANSGAKQKSQYDTFLRKILQLEAAHKVGRNNVLDSCGSNIGAGSDTTGISLSAALWYIYRNPDKLAKLREEIDTMTADGRISDPVTYKQAQEMPYLNAVIKETLRVHPAVGTILARVVPKGGMTLAGGQYIPAGTHIGANAWSLHYSEKAYGPDADKFRPERWLEDMPKPDYRESMMFAFGGGSRTCIGRNISLLEMTKVLPQIVRKFDLKFDENSPWNTYCSWFVYPKYKCWIEPRKPVSSEA